jgi:hypothetical protein
MRKGPFNFKLLHCNFFLLLFGGWVSAQEVPAQDEASLREMESQELLRQIKAAPPAPMPPWAVAHPDAESASPESRSLQSYDPATGEVTTQPADTSSAPAPATGVAPQAPALLKNADDGNCERTRDQDVLADGVDEDADNL